MSMPPAFARQIDLNYKGHLLNIRAAPRLEGWSWAALIDGRYAIEGHSDAIPSPELALAEGLASVEDFIDSGYES